nr:GHMP kinase [Desulforadius tongensis]
MTGSAAAPGTCGELVQGTVKGQPLLISCPVNIYSEISIRLHKKYPRCSGFKKMDTALEILLKKKGFGELGWIITRNSRLKPGKGMASSTADIAAALAAAARALNFHIRAGEIARIALQVEPSDGIMFNGACLLDYKQGRICQPLGSPPEADIILLDPGGTVDTVSFNRRPNLKYLNELKEREVKQALDLVCRGIECRDIEMIGRGSTISALANQKLLPKEELPEVVRWCGQLGAAGVVIAHSGTVMGLIMPGEITAPEEAADYIRKKKPHWKIKLVKLTAGGVK